MPQLQFKKIKPLTIILIILTSTIITLSFLPKAKAETKIISLTPSSGSVGTTVQVTANISTANKEYVIQFDSMNATSGNAVGNFVNASFIVPHATEGAHNVTIIDVTTGEKHTEVFTVLTSYLLETDVPKPPFQRQEGDEVQIFVNITGGKPIKPYIANITVQTPNNTSYTNLPDITTSEVGSGSITVVYPTNFTSASTNITGEYRISFNATLATKTFFIGLTNSTEYHRFQTVDIKAIYAPNEGITLTITGRDIFHSVNLTADVNGMIHYSNWSVPSYAAIGTYEVSIVSISNITRKIPPDIQNFTVPGFNINITTKNLAKEIVPNVTLQFLENATSVLNATSTSIGSVRIKLEIGNYTCKAYYKGEKVGERPVNVTDAQSFDYYCNLTNLKIQVIAVANEVEIPVPEAKIYLTRENRTLVTDFNGTAIVHSLSPNHTYVLNASRYGASFSVTSLSTLFVNGNATAWYNVTLICPTYTLRINVTNANNQPVSNVPVKVQELMGGLHYEGNTTNEGIAIFSCAFGNYTIAVYDANRIKLNEISLELFQNRSIPIRCDLYGLTISIRVVDYFGQPISNVNVTLQREGLASSLHHTTQPDGVATFSSITGGNLQIAVYLSDQTHSCVAEWLFVDSSKMIEIKIEKYAVLAGFLVETSSLITAIIIALTVLLVLLIEVYRRKRLKPQKSSS